jgi:hypothetical protein
MGFVVNDHRAGKCSTARKSLLTNVCKDFSNDGLLFRILGILLRNNFAFDIGMLLVVIRGC